MSRRITQKDNVLNHLQQHGMITPLDALKLYGAFRLGAIIHTLRHDDGYNIKTTIAKGDANYAIYSLLPSEDRTPASDAEDAFYKNEQDLIDEANDAEIERMKETGMTEYNEEYEEWEV